MQHFKSVFLLINRKVYSDDADRSRDRTRTGGVQEKGNCRLKDGQYALILGFYIFQFKFLSCLPGLPSALANENIVNS